MYVSRVISYPPLPHSSGESEEMNHPLGALALITSTLFNPDASPLEQLDAVGLMFRLYSELADMDDRAPGTEDAVKIMLPSGIAVSPRAAARCVLDVVRTVRFLRGMDAAIREARNRFPGMTIEVLYAGCGPFATLALPLCTRFTSEEVRFTLIDVNQRSLRSARCVAEALGLSGYIRDYICDDAATYRHPPGSIIHVAVAEVMQCALEKEPQFAVTANIAPQLAPGGIFVPEHIFIDLALAGPSAAPERIILHRLLDLNAGTAPLLMAAASMDEVSGLPALPAVAVAVPGLPPEPNHSIVLLTAITVFGSIRIDHQESGITLTRFTRLATPTTGDLIEARYLLGPVPRFHLSLQPRPLPVSFPQS